MNFFRRRTYAVAPRSDEWIGPEDTLVDAASDFADLEAPVPEGTFRAAGVLLAVLFAVVGAMSGDIMVRQHGRMALLAEANRTVTVAVPPPRGLILDRNGVHLVENVPSFDLLAISRQVVRGPDGGYPAARRLSGVLGIPADSLNGLIADNISRNAVFFLESDLEKEQALALTRDMPEGFYLITSTKRDYRDGEQFSSVIGYVGRVSPEDMVRDDYYLPSDTVGRAGIEAAYEEVIRGSHGTLSFVADAHEQRAAGQGATLMLNIDAQAQKALFNALFTVLRESGLGEAAAVVQDPASGAVLAMVSFPTYDNNVFNKRLSPEQFSALFENPRRPLFNRVIGGRYNPGSTIKPFIGMTALQEGVVTPGTTVPDCNAISIPNPANPSDPYVFRNWRPEAGSFDLFRAVADSCNIYFFSVGGGHGSIGGLGIGRIVDYLRRGFADSRTGVDLPGEETGFVPDPDWKWVNRKEPWYQGDTYNVSIGQGDLLLTPLWLNTYVSAIANGGTLWSPRLGQRILDDQQRTLHTYDPQALGQLPFDAGHVRTMQQAMRRTVTSGTARILQNLPVTAAAKTGTAEVIKGERINSFLTVYAPAENPQVAMTVLVEGSPSNQGYAIRAAYDFLNWYFTRQLTPRAVPATPAPEPSMTVAPEVPESASGSEGPVAPGP
ncbi:MAG TPA: penicillin-binding transpeptidase domain-containing protein [Candidatus Paceibacterota bacterium]|nr:penicillin-binding transpeptidase domain-containing protein [Candidatus Paceibacterota bacterium]